MQIAILKTGGIGWLDHLGGDWYWGMDYTSGDLYEAEELFSGGHEIAKNRLIFVNRAQNRVYEPLKARDGQYFGKPVMEDGLIYCLMVDFKEGRIDIIVLSEDLVSFKIRESLPLNSVRNCYNLMLQTSPLCLTRQGDEGRFQVVWPEKGDFAIEPSESCAARRGDTLIFSQWFEDPDYREEFVIRSYPDGSMLARGRGSIFEFGDGGLKVLE